jgi:hypothetical protein
MPRKKSQQRPPIAADLTPFQAKAHEIYDVMQAAAKHPRYVEIRDEPIFRDLLRCLVAEVRKVNGLETSLGNYLQKLMPDWESGERELGRAIQAEPAPPGLYNATLAKLGIELPSPAVVAVAVEAEPVQVPAVSKAEGHFTQVANAALRDPRISYRAKGVLAAALSHGAGFNLTRAWINRHGTEGEKAIDAAIKELKRYGYARHEYQPSGLGGMVSRRVVWTDTPQNPPV